MAKFKVGDKVITTYGEGKIVLIHNNNHYLVEHLDKINFGHDGNIAANYKFKDGHCYYFFENEIELVEESTMKSTINLKELIEKNACEEGIKWFTRNFSVKNNEEVKDVVNHPECKDSYKLWLKENGYSADDEKEKFYDEFFHQIKGKKIRWSGWNKGDWAIFDRREENKIFLKEKNFASYIDDYYYIENGFNKNQSNNNWELYQEEEKEEWFICWNKVTYSVGCNRMFESTPKMPAKGKESDLKKMYINVIRATKSDFEGLL